MKPARTIINIRPVRQRTSLSAYLFWTCMASISVVGSGLMVLAWVNQL